eukprot:973290_1
MWVPKRHHYVPPHWTLQESFHHDTLKALMHNEQTASNYYGNRMRVCIRYGPTIEGNLSYSTTDSSIAFKNTIDRSINPNPKTPVLVNFFVRCRSIGDIVLLENDTRKSILHSLTDLAKLKQVEHILYTLTSSTSSQSNWFAPLDIKHRQLYHKPSTPHSKKIEIGNNILNMKIPIDPFKDQSLSSALNECSHNLRLRLSPESLNTDWWYDALSLLHHYHQLWIQHIRNQRALFGKEETKEQSSSAQKRQNYMQWDTESERSARDIYTEEAVKSHDVYLPSFWPFYYHGPYTKSKKRHSDWKCMRCNKEPMYSFIKYYKAKRTDATMEICTRCASVASPHSPISNRRNRQESISLRRLQQRRRYTSMYIAYTRDRYRRLRRPRQRNGCMDRPYSQLPSITGVVLGKRCLCGNWLSRRIHDDSVPCGQCNKHVVRAFFCWRCSVGVVCPDCVNSSSFPNNFRPNPPTT